MHAVILGTREFEDGTRDVAPALDAAPALGAAPAVHAVCGSTEALLSTQRLALDARRNTRELRLTQRFALDAVGTRGRRRWMGDETQLNTTEENTYISEHG